MGAGALRFGSSLCCGEFSLLFPHHQDLDEVFVCQSLCVLAQPSLFLPRNAQGLAEVFLLTPQSVLLLAQGAYLFGQRIFF